jgi:hypothetical protein
MSIWYQAVKFFSIELENGREDFASVCFYSGFTASFNRVIVAACYGVHVRGSEYTPLLGASEPSSFLLGVSDVEL